MDDETANAWRGGLDLLLQSVELFLQLKSPQGAAIAFMVNGAVKYAQAMYDKKHPVTGHPV